MPPMMIASQHLTVPHAAVMPTRPASKPLQKAGTSKALGSTTNRFKMKTTKPPTQGAKVVLAATRPWATYTSTQPFTTPAHFNSITLVCSPRTHAHDFDPFSVQGAWRCAC
eukprot:4889842-Amphidinium_carterae.1